MLCQTSLKSLLILVTPETLISPLSLDKSTPHILPPHTHIQEGKVKEEVSVLTLLLHFEPIKSQDLSHFHLDFF